MFIVHVVERASRNCVSQKATMRMRIAALVPVFIICLLPRPAESSVDSNGLPTSPSAGPGRSTPMSATTNDLVIALPADLSVGNCFPFGCAYSGLYQQVYTRTQFSGSIRITELDFFNTQFNSGATSMNSGTWTITLSTTSFDWNTITTDFNGNLGSDNTVVFTGELSQPWAFGNTLRIILSTPFEYDPGNGNLLMTVTATGTSDPNGTILFDTNGNNNGALNGSTIMARVFNFAGQTGDTRVNNGYGLVTGIVGLPSIAPAAPINLQATQLGVDGTQVLLQWNYGSDPVDGFTIQRQIPSSGTGNWPLVTTESAASACRPSTTTLSSVTCSHIDTNVPAFFTTSYQISAYHGNTANSSAFSNTATAYQLKICPQKNDCRFQNIETTIEADFTPDVGLSSLYAVAQALPPESNPKFNHFNWLSYVEHWPQCYIDLPDIDKLHTAVAGTIVPMQGAPVSKNGQVDPPLGGFYEYFLNNNGLSDALPFYFNEQQLWYLDNVISLSPNFDLNGNTAGGDQIQVQTATFWDQPHLECLSDNRADYFGFLTYLIGVTTPIGATPPSYTVLNAFQWNTTYSSASGGISTSSIPPPVTGGSGRIFNVSNVNVANLPANLRQELSETGAQGVSTTPYVDTNAPMTAAFLTGSAGLNLWYTGTVTVTFIATDLDGPLDIAATTYSVDGGSTNGYFGPISVSADGSHSIEFGSMDLVGNVEAPRPSQSVKIDTTPPKVTITSPANSGIYVLNTALGSNYTCSDLTSGVAICNGPVSNGASVSTAVVGSMKFAVSATDNAGNSAISTSAYTIQYSPAGTVCLGAPGHTVLQPIKVDGSSIFKQGSTVSVKFRVCDANGVSIGTPGVVSNFALVQMLGTTTLQTDDEAVVSATPDTTFRWDATNQQWAFNFGTKNLSAGQTYVYKISLNDGTVIGFQFGLR